MFIERNVFHLRFGAGKQALALWQTFLAEFRADQPQSQFRLLTDLTGPAYVVVLELGYESYAELDPSRCAMTRHPAWPEFYRAFSALCKNAQRTLYKTWE